MKTLAKILLLLAFLIPNVVLAQDEPKKLYSHRSGSWTDFNSWTTDPSGINFNNPDEAIPDANTAVYIIAGASIKVPDEYLINCKSIRLNGELVLNHSLEHNVAEEFEGDGRIVLHIENFPNVGDNKFVEDGGTTVFQDATVTVSSGHKYSNLEINNSKVTFAGNITCDGSLSVVSGGTLIFNNSVKSTVTIKDDFQVNSGCSVYVSDESKPFDLTIGGDLRNDGTIRFTNRTESLDRTDDQDYVNVHFNSTTRNQTVSCNSQIDFYAIYMEKGISDNYVLRFTAYNKENFHIYGPANISANQNIVLDGGTLELGSNIVIPFLNKQEFYIPANSTVLVNAGIVNSDPTPDYQGAIFVEGKLQVAFTGELNARNNANGITLKKSGILEIDGGNLKAAYIKNGNETDDYGSYYQIGGNVIVDNQYDQKMCFCLSNPNSGFLMNGGVLTINHGGLKILSSSANSSVSGGKVVLKSTVGNQAALWSTAAFPSLTIENSSAMQVIPQPECPLVVTGDLTVGENCSVIYNNADVYVAGNLIVDGAFSCTDNTTYINGNGNSEMKLSDDFEFANLTICKETSSATITTNKSFSVAKNLTITGGTFVNGEHNINVNLDISVENGGISSTTGYIKLANNDHYHTLTSPLHNPCCFGNLHYAGSNNLRINGPVITQNFEFDETRSKIVELNGHYVEVQGELLGAGPNKYFLNKGDVSGGLCLHFTLKKGENKTINFPIGDNVNGNKYTPAEIVVTGSMLPQNYTGSVRVNVVSKSHPNLLTNNNIQRYWGVTQNGFDGVPNGAVQYNFTNSENISSNYIAAGLVHFKGWKNSDIAVDGGKIFSFKNTNFGFISGYFTCAQNTDYDIKVYRTWSQTAPTKDADNPMYRMDKSDHNNNATWRLLDENGEETDIPGIPGPHDIAYIYFNRVDVRENKQWEVGQLVFVDTDPLYAPDDLEHQPRLQVHPNANVTIHMLSGEGVIAQYIGSSNNIVHIDDITAFAKESHSWMMYILTADVTDVEGYPELPNLALEDPHNFSFGTTSKVINFDLNMRGKVQYIFPNENGGDLFVGRDLYIGDWKGAQILFNGNGQSHTLTVKGDLILSHNGNPKSYNDGDRNITVGQNPTEAALLEHRLVVGGNIKLGSKKLQLSKQNDGKITGIVLELNGNKDAELVHKDPSNNSSGTLEFWKIVMNKENGKSFIINRDFRLKAAEPDSFAGVLKPITMTSGRLVLNNNTSSRNYLLSPNGDDFEISADAVLETTGKAQYTLNTGMILSGGLKLDGGSTWNVDKSIVYTESATCELYIGDATMNVGAQLRPPEAAGGSISLTLANAKSVLNVGTNSDIVKNTRGIFDLVNMSSLTMASKSKLIIKNFIDESNVPDININPNYCNIDSEAELIVDAAKSKPTTILSKVDIPRLTVKNNSHLKMKGALTVNQMLTVDQSNEFATGGFELYLKGDANFAGTFTHNNNTTYIYGTGEQNIKGNITFYNLVTNTTDTVKFKNTITIDNQADFLKGAFRGNTIIAKGNVVNNAYYDCPNYGKNNSPTVGFIFQGSALQTLKSDGNGSFIKIVIDNENGVKLPTGNSFTVVKRFQLNKGIFDIGTCIITMGKDAVFMNGSGNRETFAVTNMVQVTDAYATGGVRKVFDGSTSKITIPIGTTDKYTPVRIEPSAVNLGAALTIRPVNEMTNCKPGNSILGYFWTIKAENVNKFSGNLIFKFSPSEVVPSSMVGVFHCDATDEFKKFDGSGVWNNGKRELKFSFSNVSSDSLSGKYLGSSTSGDIASIVPVYYIDGLEGNEFADWNDPTLWYTFDSENKRMSVQEVPSNAVVHINKNVTMKNVPQTGVTECKVYIEDGAVLDQDLSMHNDFGSVMGTGTLKSKSGDLPAGVYDVFNSENGGTIHYYGGGDDGNGYSILKQMPTVNNLIIESIDEQGKEVKKFPNMPVQILGNFTINGNVSNEDNAVISLKGNLKYSNGFFTTGNLGKSQFVFNGTDWQTVEGRNFTETNCIFNMVVDNPVGVKLYNDVFVHNTIEFNQGVIYPVEPDGLLTLDNADPNSVIGYGQNSFVGGPFRKRINNGENYTFPVGDINLSNHKVRYGPLTLQDTETGASVFWTVRYFYDAPYEWESYEDDLISVSTNEYWSIYAGGDNYKAKILTRWDGISPIMNQTLKPEDLRQVYFNRTTGKWEISGNNVVVTSDGGYVESFETREITTDKTNTDLFSFGFQTEWNYCWCGCEDDDWFNSNNWVMGFAPTHRTQVKIGGDFPNWPVIRTNPEGEDIPATVGNLILCDKATLDIESRGKLTVTSNVTVDPTAKLTLKAPTAATDKDAYGYHSVPPSGSLIYGGDFSGDVIFERYVRNCVFERMAIPVTGFDKKLIVHPAYDIYYANEAFNLDKDPVNYTYSGNKGDQSLADNPHILRAGWKLFNNPNVNCIDSAYLLCSYEGRARAFSFKGKPLANESAGHIIPVNFTLNDKVTISDKDEDIYSLDGWNFIPNPFLSAVDINKMEFENVDATVYVHDNVSDKSFCYQKNASEQAGFIPINGNYNPQYIAGGQSFFVHAKKAAAGYNGRVIFPNECLTHGDENTLIKSTTSGDNSVDKIVFYTSGKGGNFQSVVYFRNNATTGFDSDYDAYLQETMDAGVLNFYSVGSNYFEPLMINGLPQSIKQGGEIKLGYSTSTAGVYTLTLKKFTVNDVIVYLEDTQEGTSTPLSAGFTCQVNVEKGTNNKRFKLVFRTNNAPLAKAQINDFETEAGKDFEYAVGTELFADNDLDDYVADVNVTAKDGALLPSWLMFDYNNGEFIGSPAVADAGRYNIEIVATDSRGAKSAPLTFAIIVTEPTPDPVTPPSGPVTITITRPTEDPVNNTDNPEVSNPDVVTPNPDNIVTVEDPVIPIYVDPESPVTVEQLYPEVVDIEPVLPEVVEINPVENVIPSDINPVLPDIIPEITPDPIEIQEPIVDDNAEMPLPDPVQFVDNDEVFVTPFGDGNMEVDEDIKIYPVPSDGRVTVDFGSLIHETGSVQMTLITGSGRILTRKTVYDDSIYLDLTGRTGIYLIRLATPSKTITKRIIIQ